MIRKYLIGLLIIGQGFCCKIYFPGPGQVPILYYKDKDILKLITVERNYPNDAVSSKITSSCTNNPTLPEMYIDEKNRRYVLFKKVLKVPMGLSYHNCMYYAALVKTQVQYQMTLMTLQRNEDLRWCGTDANVCEYQIDIDWSTNTAFLTNTNERIEQLVSTQSTPTMTTPSTTTAATTVATTPISIPVEYGVTTPEASDLVEYSCVPENGTKDDDIVLIHNDTTPAHYIKMKIYLNKLGDTAIECQSRDETANLSLKLTRKNSDNIEAVDLYYVKNHSYNLTCGGGSQLHWIIENEINKVVDIKTENTYFTKIDKITMNRNYDKFKVYCVAFTCTFHSELTADCTEEITKEIAMHLMSEEKVSDDYWRDSNAIRRLIYIIVGVCLPVLVVVAVTLWWRRRCKKRPRLPTPRPERRPTMEPYYSVAREGLTQFGRWEVIRTAYETRKPPTESNSEAPKNSCVDNSRSKP